jgi:hypothetical protein
MLIKNAVVVPEHLLPRGAANFLRQQGNLAGWGPVARKSNTSFFLQEAFKNTWILNGFLLDFIGRRNVIFVLCHRLLILLRAFARRCHAATTSWFW